MPKTALLLLAEGFEDVEAVTAVDVLRRAAVEVTVAALKPGLTRGARGTAVQADALLDDVKDGVFDAVVLPGGNKGAENLAVSPVVKSVLQRFQKEGKIVAAICAAPGVVLAPAGLLDGRAATGYPGTESRFPASAAPKTDAVVSDGNLLTGRAMGSSLAFALALVEKLLDKEAAEKVRQAVLA
jgi:4-methyl-5(b-hydroxyethyl)-thiazole monophosphate biosynthesis